MNPPTDDRDLEEYLGGTSEVSRRYRSATAEEPPAELDRAVMAQARGAIESLPSNVRRLPNRKAVRWVVPFAVAATVVLTFSIIHRPGMEPTVTLQERKTTAPVFEPESAPTQAPAPVAVGEPVTAAHANIKPEADAIAGAESQSALEKPSASISAAPPPATDKATNVLVDPAPVELPRAIAAPLKADAEQRPISGRLKTSSDDLKKAQAPGGLKDTSSPATFLFREEAPVVTTSTAIPSIPPLESKKTMTAEKLREPKAWLEDIRKLRTAGKQVEAETELKLFVEAHPDYFKTHPEVIRP